MVANTTAANPSHELIAPSVIPAANSAPTIVIPDIAFAPDIRGVWRIGGTPHDDFAQEEPEMRLEQYTGLKDMNGKVTQYLDTRGGRTYTVKRVSSESWKPKSLQEYTGTYYCHELDALYRVIIKEETDISETSNSAYRSWRQNISDGKRTVGTRSMPSGFIVPSRTGQVRGLEEMAMLSVMFMRFTSLNGDGSPEVKGSEKFSVMIKNPS